MRRTITLFLSVFFIFVMSAIYGFISVHKEESASFESKVYKSISILHQSRFLCPKIKESEIDLSCLCRKHELMNQQIAVIEKLMQERPEFHMTNLHLHDANAGVDIVYDLNVVRSLKQELSFCDE